MKTWIIATDNHTFAEHTGAFDAFNVLAVGVEPAAELTENAAAVIRLGLGGNPAEAAVPAVLKALGEAEIVLTADTSAGRVLAGAVAATRHLPIFTNVVAIESGRIRVGRFGGLVIDDVELSPLVAVVPVGETSAEPAAPLSAEPEENYPVTVENVERVEVGANLANAERVAVAGRGFAEETDLELLRDFAAAIDAEVGCTRPLAEGSHWMPRENYVGVSGQVIQPEVYVAVGVSGQIHHTAGVEKSGTIVAVCDDPTAPIFELADYGIVGDLYEVLPVLTSELK